MAASNKKTGRGRPSSYTPQLAEQINALLAEGKSEREIARMPGMPVRRTITEWKDEHPEFLRQSARAREDAADYFDDRRRALCDELVDLARSAVKAGKGLPSGTVEALKVAMQELARSAAIRDDSRYGDRKTVKLEPGAGAGEGLKAFYEQWMRDEQKPVS